MFVDIISTFNNREIATAIWLMVLLIWALSLKGVRASLVDVIKALFHLKVFIPIILSAFYTSIIAYLLYKVGVWNYLLIKDTVYWFLITALVLLFNSNKANEENKYFKKLLFETFKFYIVLEFIINLYPLSLIFELILIPIVSIVAMMTIFASTNKEYAIVEKTLNYFLMIIGFYFLAFAAYNIANNSKLFFTINNLQVFTLPIILTISYVPFIYLIALWIKYEETSMRIGLFLNDKDKALAKYMKRKTFIFCFINLKKLNKFSKYIISKFDQINNQNDVIDIIDRFKQETV